MAGVAPSGSPKQGEWMKGKLVGSGSFGTVHLAMSKSTGGLFVVKSAHSRAEFAALENEVEILKNLEPSPYTVQYLGSERDGDDLNVLMEYMAGGSLADIAEKFGGSLQEDVVRLYTKEILKGLKYLHGNGIVHCDLKCKNVLLGSSGDIKLADFGCARRVEDLKNKCLMKKKNNKSLEHVSGTPLWMAPEVLRNEKLDFAADIWSLGCTVIEMTTGRPPWGASNYDSNPMAVLLKIACGDEIPQFPTHFSKEGLDFLRRCLERDSRKRWTCEELLRHPFISRDSSETTPPSSSKDTASSPVCVLGISSFEGAYDLDEPESPEGNDFSVRNPFTCCKDGRKGSEMQRHGEECGLCSSQNWITIRS
ncbi:mitogen-activated protein kinase kinase kinase 17-like [Prosopis cineraria]|uniref:mitogen-activated protein kinase kinase kinase 17-like n=1 Tax=Prosopis cineraria TaxID=364024 RepID=UPI00240F06DE|nr:mitogen-activated protein kinase kinase kinase 17-like [Prosopis cineraria]